MTNRTTGKLAQLGAATFGLGCLVTGAAVAAPIVCTSTIVLSGAGNGFEADSSLGAGVCVQTLDAVFGNFNLADLPAGGSVDFNVTNVGSPAVAYHGISFNDNYTSGLTYTLGYSVEILTGSNLFNNLDSDFTQTNGTSTLKVTSTEAGMGSIDWTKVGAVGSGPNLITYTPGFTRLDITDVLTDGGAVSAITNNVIENKPVTVFEPQSAAILVSGMAGLILLRRKQKQSVAASPSA